MPQMKISFLCLMLLGAFFVPRVQAQNMQETPGTKRPKQVEKILKELAKVPLGQSDSLWRRFAEQVPKPLQGDSLQSAFLRAWQQAYYEDQVWSYRHRQDVFAWQLLSSKIIFVVVLILVFVGIFFSGVQFYKSLKWGPGEKEGASPAASITEFEATAKGIKVSSPVLGVIILVISLAFFYLYLVRVFPIEELH